MQRAIALADDLTGALETGALLAQNGTPALVTLDPFRTQPEELLVIDTETRHVPPDVARSLHCSIAERHSGRIFKKTDSTLRGPIAAEFRGLLDARQGEQIEYIPAYPKMGRTVRSGVLYVDGIPLAETSFACDPRNPARHSSVRQALGGMEGVRIWDAESDRDLERVAATIGPAPLIASPAGFIPYWMPEKRTGHIRFPQAGAALAVCGSLHPRSREQAAAAARAGWEVIASGERKSGTEQEAAAHLAAEAAARMPLDTLLVFGGDTAHAILRRLGCRDIHPIGEALPGVPVSRIHVEGRPVTLITKAGGFGPPDLAERVRATLGKNT